MRNYISFLLGVVREHMFYLYDAAWLNNSSTKWICALSSIHWATVPPNENSAQQTEKK